MNEKNKNEMSDKKAGTAGFLAVVPRLLITCLLTTAVFAYLLTGCGKKENTASPADAAEAVSNDGNSEGSDGNGTPSGVVNDSDRPTFSVTSGFYESDFDLEITLPKGYTRLYYTTDGTAPDNTSTEYTGPITLSNATSNPNVLSAKTGIKSDGDFIPKNKVDKANVIRCVAYDDNGNASGIANGTFFVGIDRNEKYPNTSVASIFIEPDDFFDYEKGIYVLGKMYDDWLAENPANKYAESWQVMGNFMGKGREWERETVMQFIDADGDLAFEEKMGVRIMGAAARRGMQKNFRFILRKDYGNKKLEYDLIPGNTKSDGSEELTTYKSFVFRTGGNDAHHARIRDPFLQDMVSERSFETQETTPVVLFINGEYWGAYTITEDYSDNYVENNYEGVDNKNVIIVKNGEIEEGEDEDLGLYKDMVSFFKNSDLSDPALYEQACGLIDVTGFAEYCAFQLFIDNKDGPFKNNNVRYYRVREADYASEVSDGKWRCMAFDTEYSAELYNDGSKYRNNSIKDAMSYSSDTKTILKSLLANEEFGFIFINAMCDMSNIDFEKNKVLAALDEYYETYAPLMKDTFERFGPDWAVSLDLDDFYYGECEKVRTFMKGRPGVWQEIVGDYYKLADPVTVTVKSSDYGLGGFTVNTSKHLFTEDYSGSYFPDYGFEIHAAPASGHSPDGFTVENGTVVSESEDLIRVIPKEGCVVTVKYK